MIKNFFYGLIFCVNLLEVDAAQVFSDHGVTQNFKAMLEDKPIVGEQDFATFVTRSFLRSSSNIELSDPTFYYWRQLQSSYNAASPQSSYNAASPQPDALHIFETLGISFRGIMNSPHKDRWGEDMVGAERDGMLKIIQGSLGVESRRATKKEEAVMARELLNLGRSFGWGIHEKLESLETKYNTESESFKKQHFQMTALYLLVGSGQAPHPGAWYFNGVDEHNAIKHVLSYAGNSLFLPMSSPSAPPSKGAVYASNQGFVDDVGDLNAFRYVETLDGGTGGVNVFSRGEHKVLIKCSVHTNHIKEEIIADALYAALGVPVPKFFVVNELPSGAATGAGVGAGGVVADGFSQVRARCPKGPYRVSEFIEGDRAASETAEKVRVRRHFLVDALLANRDVKPENLIISGGIPNRVDNGGALRYRSLGERKDQESGSTWSHLLLPERKTLLEYNADRYGGKLSDEDILPQAREILKKSDLIFLTLQELYAALQMPLKDQQELDDMMLERLKILTMYANPTATFVAPKHVTVTKGMAAGAFVLAQKDGVWHVLLGLRKSARPESNNKWCTLGGMADVGEDMDLPHAAAREMFEESGGRLNISHTVLANQPSHDLVRWDHRFRQYFVTHNYFDVSDLKYREYHRFAWVPLERVISTNLGELGDFFHPF